MARACGIGDQPSFTHVSIATPWNDLCQRNIENVRVEQTHAHPPRGFLALSVGTGVIHPERRISERMHVFGQHKVVVGVRPSLEPAADPGIFQMETLMRVLQSNSTQKQAREFAPAENLCYTVADVKCCASKRGFRDRFLVSTPLGAYL
jgi:hypothetical protein